MLVLEALCSSILNVNLKKLFQPVLDISLFFLSRFLKHIFKAHCHSYGLCFGNLVSEKQILRPSPGPFGFVWDLLRVVYLERKVSFAVMEWWPFLLRSQRLAWQGNSDFWDTGQFPCETPNLAT